MGNIETVCHLTGNTRNIQIKKENFNRKRIECIWMNYDIVKQLW